MTLIEQVEELKKLAERAGPAGAYTFSRIDGAAQDPDMEYMAGVLNAAPKLLEVAGMFQPGSSRLLQWAQDVAITESRDEYGDPTHRNDEVIACLRRLQEAAKTMEVEGLP